MIITAAKILVISILIINIIGFSIMVYKDFRYYLYSKRMGRKYKKVDNKTLRIKKLKRIKRVSFYDKLRKIN